MSVRLADYETHLNVVTPGVTLRVRVEGFRGSGPFAVSLRKLTRAGGVPGTRVVASLGRLTFGGDRETPVPLPDSLAPGYHLLWIEGTSATVAVALHVARPPGPPAPIGVVRPVFTEWAYHHDGFDPADPVGPPPGASPLSAGLARARGLAGRILRASGVRRPPRRSGFPAHWTVGLRAAYRTNRRWDRSRWHEAFAGLEGLWCDEMLVAMPTWFALESAGLAYDVYSDLDLHRANPALAGHETLLLLGQHGTTCEGFAYMRRLLVELERPAVLWGGQDYGYRQLAYDEAEQALSYVGARGRRDLWGSPLEGPSPPWGSEGEAIGFEFPEPAGPDWRRPYRSMRVREADHPIVRAAGLVGGRIDFGGAPGGGLLGTGGEYFRRYAPEARVVACLDDDEDVVGIGVYRRAVVFSPTYLPAFGFYAPERFSVVERLLVAALTLAPRA